MQRSNTNFDVKSDYHCTCLRDALHRTPNFKNQPEYAGSPIFSRTDVYQGNALTRFRSESERQEEVVVLVARFR